MHWQYLIILVPVRRKAKVELSVEQIDKEPVQFEVVATSEDVLPADYLEEVADEEEGLFGGCPLIMFTGNVF